MSQPALDKMITIADAFDRGAFAGMVKVDTDTISTIVGVSVTGRILNKLGFTQQWQGGVPVQPLLLQRGFGIPSHRVLKAVRAGSGVELLQ